MDNNNEATKDDYDEIINKGIIKSFEKQELTDNHNIKQYICD